MHWAVQNQTFHSRTAQPLLCPKWLPPPTSIGHMKTETAASSACVCDLSDRWRWHTTALHTQGSKKWKHPPVFSITPFLLLTLEPTSTTERCQTLEMLEGSWVPSLNKTGENWFEVEWVFSSDQPAISQSSCGSGVCVCVCVCPVDALCCIFATLPDCTAVLCTHV